MSPQAPIPLRYSAPARDALNRANAQHSTGPKSDAGKQRSSLNALTHGLTARTPVLPSEDPAAYQQFCSRFSDEYRPATPTETQFVHELADTAWRINRIPLLEAALLDRAANPPSDAARIAFDIVDAHRALATLGLHGQRLSRQFHKTLEQLREIQSERRERERRDLRDAAAVSELHKHKGIPFDPAQAGFRFFAIRNRRFRPPPHPCQSGPPGRKIPLSCARTTPPGPRNVIFPGLPRITV